METFLLDSGVVIDILNGKRDRAETVRRLLHQGGELACCSIIITEIYAGMRPSEEARTEQLLRSLKFYNVDWETARLAGNLKNYWAKQGRTIPLPDITIAAVVLTHKLVLLTNNRKDFPMPELRLHSFPS